MLESIKDRMSHIKSTATKADKILMDFLERNEAQDIMYSSITELAELTNVGEATILRFCRKLGLKGYQEFKLLIAQDNVRYTHEQNGYAANIAENMINCIKDTLKLVDYKSMDEAADIIMNANNPFIMGCGNSGIAALEMANKLMRSGVHVGVATDPHFQAIIASTLNSSDALLLISVSGSTVDMLNIASDAKKNNIPIVVITNSIKSPLSKYAKVMLPSVRKEAPHDGGSLITKVSQLFTIDVLCRTIINKLGTKGASVKEKTAASVAGKII